MAVTIKDVATAAGVSISTVSNVMNGKNNVGGETRMRILQLCEDMHYVPNTAGKTLKGGSGGSRSILFNFSDFDRSFYLKIIAGISGYAVDNGYELIICTWRSCEKYLYNNLTDGCIILDERMQNDMLLKAARERYPIVVLDRVLPNPFIKSIVVNNHDPMTELVQGLVDHGCRTFSFIGGHESTDDTKERFAAFRDVLQKNNLPFQRRNFFSGDYREGSGYKAAKIAMLAEELPDALVCANDNMAIGAIKAFTEKGIRVPEDIVVTGFDDCELAETVGLTTVAIPNYERGYLAARSLIENIKGEKDFGLLKIPAAVKWRKTTESIF
jgi:LacI family transcriptional regulator